MQKKFQVAKNELNYLVVLSRVYRMSKTKVDLKKPADSTNHF